MQIFAYWIRDWRFRKSLHGGRRCIGNSILVILGKGHSFAELRPFLMGMPAERMFYNSIL